MVIRINMLLPATNVKKNEKKKKQKKTSAEARRLKRNSLANPWTAIVRRVTFSSSKYFTKMGRIDFFEAPSSSELKKQSKNKNLSN